MMWDGMRACAWRTRSGLALVAATALASGGSPARAENVEAEVKAVGAAFGQACEKGDVAAVVALYDDRASAVFPGEGQEAKGKLNLARLIGEMCRPGTKAMMRDMQVYPLGSDAAATVGHWELESKGPDGKVMKVKVRTSEVLVKKDGTWRYLIDHASVGVPSPPARAAAAAAGGASAGKAARAAGDQAGEATKDAEAAPKSE